jgi:hypothetical protein
MIHKKTDEKEFYKDVLYFNLINRGYSPKKAEFIVKRIYSEKENNI